MSKVLISGCHGGLDNGLVLTLFLNCLWMASKASLIVTPLRFRAVTSKPSGKWRSIFFTGGSVKSFLRMSFSSTVLGDVFTFLSAKGCPISQLVRITSARGLKDSPSRLLCLGRNLELLLLGSFGMTLSAWRPQSPKGGGEEGGEDRGNKHTEVFDTVHAWCCYGALPWLLCLLGGLGDALDGGVDLLESF